MPDKSEYERFQDMLFQEIRNREDMQRQREQASAQEVSRLAKKLTKWVRKLSGKQLTEGRARATARALLSAHEISEAEFRTLVEAIRSAKE